MAPRQKEAMSIVSSPPRVLDGLLGGGDRFYVVDRHLKPAIFHLDNDYSLER
jgi:hypothetical protein